MKKISILLVLVVANITVALAEANSAASAQGAEASQAESVACPVGGPGSTQCSIEAGQSIDGGVSIGCSVTCAHDFYACCGLDCKCVSYYPTEK